MSLSCHPSLLTPLQLKLGAFCALMEVISRGDAGGGALETDQWQICGSERLRKMKLSLAFLFFFCWKCVPTCKHTHIPAHTPGRIVNAAASMSLQTQQRQGFGTGQCFSVLSLFHVPVAVVTANHPGYKKPRIKMEFFHQNSGKVKGQNIWVWSEHLGLLGTRRPWAPDSHSVLGRFIWFSLKSL